MFKSIWLWVAGFLAILVTFVRAIFLRRVRLSLLEGVNLLDLLKTRGRQFIINEERFEGPLPREYAAFCLLGLIPFFLSIEERMLRAGHSGTDSIVTVTLFRFQYNRLFAKLEKSQSEQTGDIPVYILQPWDAERIGSIKVPDEIPFPYLPLSQYAEIEENVKEVVGGKRGKVGILLYGEPGNGKSYLLRYFALKYRLPIYIVTFTPDTDNHAVIRMFSRIKGPALVLLEDFDAYFNKRDCVLENAKLTFDSLLNVIDGIYSTPTGILFGMTVNDIDKVDDALKERPSRFKFVEEIGYPDSEIRERIFFGDKKLAEETKGLSLDKLLHKSEKVGTPFGGTVSHEV